MAKLSAHGRTELARMEKSTPIEPGTYHEPGGVCLTTIALMSDGTVLRKWKNTYPNQQPYTSGWTVKGKLKTPAPVAQLTIDSWISAYKDKGFTRV